jgi:hypothetical protein
MRIDKFKRIDKQGSPLKASFMAIVPEWDLFLRMTYFQKDSGESWFGYPSQEFINDSGEKKRVWLAFFGDKGKPRFEEALKKELNKIMQADSGNCAQSYKEEELPF